MRTRPYILLALLCACGPKAEPGVTVITTSELAAVVEASLEFLPGERRHVVAADPVAEQQRRGGTVIAVVPRTDCTDCYTLEGNIVRGGAPLGAQYGLAHALEAQGFGFFHPWKTSVGAPKSPESGDYQPEVDQRRGLHLHTLHPIEAYYDFWESGEANLEGAKRTIDFIVKNRGNYVQWLALDDILKGVDNKAHQAAIVAYAHMRGLKTGIGIQLFGKSNLQNAFDLIDEDPDPGVEMRRRLHVLLDGVPHDNVNLSFGEFFGADPAVFVQRVEEAYAAIQEVAPGIEVSSPIHLGDQPSLKVTYMGETLLYYFLIKFARAPITPWVHTVMYYNLYEDAGGAYFHDDFRDHRAFIEGKLSAGQPVSYFPESAYWIAFDNTIPMYLPLYMRSRWLDLKSLKPAGRLRDHVLFSSGWEWGYWQTDAATLRMNYTLPDRWDAPIKQMLGEQAGELIYRLGEEQHDALIIKRLAAYLAGRDQIIDAGEALGIVSQPDRIQFDEIAANPDFRARVFEPLKAHAAAVTAIDADRAALGLSNDDPFLAELNDAFEITARRARFVVLVNEAALDKNPAAIMKAQEELDAAKLVISRRRKAMHDPDVKPLIRNTPNATFYQYGYLREADTLCFWEREMAQVRFLVLQVSEPIPGCIL